jgi:hypothetical protein
MPERYDHAIHRINDFYLGLGKRGPDSFHPVWMAVANQGVCQIGRRFSLTESDCDLDTESILRPSDEVGRDRCATKAD